MSDAKSVARHSPAPPPLDLPPELEAARQRDPSLARALQRATASDARLQQIYDVLHDPERDSSQQELLIVAQALVMCGLPYRPLRNPDGSWCTHYVREARTARGVLRVTFGSTDPRVPIAYGQDRTLLAWLTTKAFQLSCPTVTWASAREFLDAFEIAKGGSQYRLFAERWARLTKLFISVERRTNVISGHNRTLFASWLLPEPRTAHRELEGGQARIPQVPYSVTFSADFYQDLQHWHIPLPLPVMREFANEPKAWDFAGFVIYRSWLTEMAGQHGRDPVARIRLPELMTQLGSTDRDSRQLRRSLRDILARLVRVWPEGRAQFEGSVLQIAPPVGGVHLVLPRA